jgi:uncharacterized protein
MGAIALLAQLNEIDLAVDASKARLAEIAQEVKEPAALQAARTALAAAQVELARCRDLQVQREAAQKKVADHLAVAEKGLYSGKTKNSKELEAAERDVQQVRRQLAHADDELLEALVATEAAAEAMQTHAAEVAQLGAAWEANRERLRAEHAQVKARLADEQARQLAARRAARDDLLTVYDALRVRRAGRATAALEGEECSACGVAVPQSKREAARDGETIIYCGNCGRILWDPTT